MGYKTAILHVYWLITLIINIILKYNVIKFSHANWTYLQKCILWYHMPEASLKMEPKFKLFFFYFSRYHSSSFTYVLFIRQNNSFLCSCFLIMHDRVLTGHNTLFSENKSKNRIAHFAQFLWYTLTFINCAIRFLQSIGLMHF